MTATETFYQSFFPAPNVKLKVLEFFMELKIDIKFEGKLTCASKNAMRI